MLARTQATFADHCFELLSSCRKIRDPQWCPVGDVRARNGELGNGGQGVVRAGHLSLLSGQDFLAFNS